MRGPLKVLILLCTLGWPLAALSAAADTPEFQKKVQAMLDSGQGEQAYQALQKRSEYEGEGWYELMLAQAELQTGKAGDAIARLEPYVAANPQQDQPRFLLAQAYTAQGQADRAAAQYRHVYEKSPFEGSREQARARLASMGEPPVIPVGEGGPQKPQAPPPAPEAAEFGVEKSGLIAEAFLGGGFDSNANSGTDAERYFFYDLSREQKNSDAAYLTGGGSVVVGWALEDDLAWRTGIAVAGTSNPDAHFADSQDASMQMQLRWSGKHQRLSAGLVHSLQTIDQRRSDTVLAVGLKLEMLTDVLLASIGGEAARLRFPHVPLRDVDTFFLRTEVTPAPRDDARWVPRAAAVFGFEEEKREDSPFGRNLWGLILGAERILSPRWSLDGEAGYTRSMFDEAFLAPKHRSDDTYQARLYAHFTPSDDSAYQHSFGVRFRANSSNEPLYEFDRFVVGYEISGTWGEADTPAAP